MSYHLKVTVSQFSINSTC